MIYQDWRVTKWGLILMDTQKNSFDSAKKIKETPSMTLLQEAVSWNTFLLLTGKNLNPKKRMNKKVRIFRKGGNVFVSDHEWIQGEIYKKDNVKAQVAYINAERVAILNILDGRLNVITSVKPLEWRIA